MSGSTAEPSPDPALNTGQSQDVNLDLGRDTVLGTDSTQRFESVVRDDPSRGPDPDSRSDPVAPGDLVMDHESVSSPNPAPEGRPKRTRKAPDRYGEWAYPHSQIIWNNARDEDSCFV